MDELLRGGQTDEYHMYLYGKTNNDFRSPNNANTPRYYWELIDFGTLPFTFYEKVKAAIESMLESRGYYKFLLFENETVHDMHPYLYVEKYGDEMSDIINRLMPIEVENLAESGNPSLSQLAVVLTNLRPRTEVFTYNPAVLNIQEGIIVPAAPAAPAATVAAPAANNNQYFITNYGASAQGNQRRARRTRRQRKARRATRHRRARRV